MVRTAKAKKPKRTSSHRVQSLTRETRPLIAAPVDWDDCDTPLHKISRQASADESTADGNGLARRRSWLPPLSEEDEAAYRASFEEETLADFGYPFDLTDFVAWLSAEWPQFESSPIIVKHASARPALLYFGKSAEGWASVWGVTPEPAAERLKDQLDDGAAAQAMRAPVARPSMADMPKPEPIVAAKPSPVTDEANASRKRGGQFLDLTGHRYNLLTAIKFSHQDQREKSVWLWQCDCGEKTLATANNVRTNNTISCGCFLESSIRQRSQVGGPLTAHEVAEWREYVEPCPIDRMCDEGGMQYAPVEPPATVAEPEALPMVAQPVRQPQRAPEPVRYDMKTRAGRRSFEKAARKEQQQKQREHKAQGFPSIANTARAFVQVLFEQGPRK